MPRNSVRVLFDKSVPVPLRKSLAHHTVATVAHLGWDTLTNGALLAAAAQAGYDVFVTGDQNILHQHSNLGTLPFGIVVLGSNLWPVISADTTSAAQAIDAATPGSYRLVSYPKPPRRRQPARMP